MMNIEKIAVLGAGQMGNGITQVAACAGYSVTMIDIKQEFVDRGIASIEKSLAKLVSKERMTQIDADASRERISERVIFTFVHDPPRTFAAPNLRIICIVILFSSASFISR